jgi:hypothetical protein
MELADAVQDCSRVAACECEVGEDDEDWEDDTDESLGEDVEGAAGGEGPAEDRVRVGVLLGGDRPHDRRGETAPIMGHPIFPGSLGTLGFWLSGLLYSPVAVEGEGEPEADDGVGDEDAGEDEDAEAGEEEESSVEAGACGVEGAAGEGFDDECQCEDGECEGEACGGGADTEEFEVGGHGPVEEWGFFEVADTVGVESDPVVAKEHLAGDLGVDGVGVVEEWRGDEGETGVKEEPECEEDEAVALCLGLGGGDVHAVRSGRNGKISSAAKAALRQRIYGAT